MHTYLTWIVNYLAFYAVWVVCTIAAKVERPLVGLPVVLAYLCLHLTLVSRSWKKEAFLITVLTAFGALNETFLSLLGAVVYKGASYGGVAWWTLALWASFATTYWHAFSWLSSRRLLSSLLGATVVPVCYAWFGAAGAIQYPHGPLRALVTIGAVWALTLPVTFYISELIDHGRVKKL